MGNRTIYGVICGHPLIQAVIGRIKADMGEHPGGDVEQHTERLVAACAEALGFEPEPESCDLQNISPSFLRDLVLLAMLVEVAHRRNEPSSQLAFLADDSEHWEAAIEVARAMSLIAFVVSEDDRDESLRAIKDPSVFVRLREYAVKLLREVPFRRPSRRGLPAAGELAETEAIIGVVKESRLGREFLALVREQVPPDVEGRTADEYVAALSDVCQRADDEDGSDDAARAEWIEVAAAVHQEVHPRAEFWNLKRTELRSIADRKRNRLRLIQTTSAVQRGAGIDCRTSIEDVLSTIEVSRAFEEAIAPRPLRSVLEHPAMCEQRVRIFVERRNWSDEQMRKHLDCQVRSILRAADSRAALAGVLGYPMLRTFTDARLRDIADNFREGHPYILCIRDPESPGACSEHDLNSRREEAIRIVAKDWRDLPHYSVRDAVGDALLRARSTEPALQYRYEQPLLVWLVRTAIDNMHDAAKDGLAPLGAKPVVAPAVITACNASIEMEVVARERFMLVYSFFKGELSRLRVKVIWKCIPLKGQKGIKLTDKRIGVILEYASGEPCPEGTIPVTRHRLRQKLDVIQYFFTAEDWHKLSDKEVLRRLALERSVAEKDVPTLRELAAHARASLDDDSTLVWSILSRCVAWNATFDAECERGRAVQLIEARNVLNPSRWNAGTMKKKLGLALQWTQKPTQMKRISRLRGQAREKEKQGFGLYLAPCWYLSVTRGRHLKEILHLLKPRQDEEANVATIHNTLLGTDPKERESLGSA